MTKQILFFSLLLFLTWNCSKEPISETFYSNAATADRSTYTISGKVVWEKDSITAVNGVKVVLSGTQSGIDTTDSNGNYSFSVSTLGTYTLTPTKNTGWSNGVSSADATFIQQYITNYIPTVPSPYKLIAMDTNKSNNITTADAFWITQALAGHPTGIAYLMNPSWRFVDKAYNLTFPPVRTNVPTGYPQSISVNISGDSFNNDFIGVKRGDVNGTADPSL